MKMASTSDDFRGYAQPDLNLRPLATGALLDREFLSMGATARDVAPIKGESAIGGESRGAE
jgi:hypothetical protein